MRSRRVVLDELTPISERLRWLQLCRSLTMAALPLLARATGGDLVHRIDAVTAGWLALTLASWAAARAGRSIAITVLTIALLGDGVVLVACWDWLGALDGPVGPVIILHTIAVTLVASFRTGVKMALWHSLLALFVLDLHATAIVSPQYAFPTLQVGIDLAGLWAAAVGTAALAAVNERELRRRRYDEQALRVLALQAGAAEDPGAVAAVLARFAVDELTCRRAAVVIGASPQYADQLGPAGLAARAEHGTARLDVRMPARFAPPPLDQDEILLFDRPDPVLDAWLLDVLPEAADVAVVPMSAGGIDGVLALEFAAKGRRRTGTIERRLVMTARQAAAQTAAAVGRAVAVAALSAAASLDGLTGLLNRSRLDRHLDEYVTAAVPFALVLLDLDHFKAVNDTYGHQSGDAVLRGVARALTAARDGGDVVARYGGEELVVLSRAGAADPYAFAEHLRAAVASADTPVRVTASIGVATYPVDETTAESLLETADRRLYIAKRAGRDRAVTSSAQALAAGEPG